MHISKRIYIAVMTTAIFTGLVNCRTSQNSEVKDVGLSPQDLSASSPVLWQDASNYVHYGLCPVGSASINRNCQGLVEKFFPLTYSAFSKDLIDNIVAARPQGANVPVSQKLADINDKIKRLNDKINAGGLTATATANFKAQIEQLEKEQADPNLQLTADELKSYDKITVGLQAGKDIAIDEGESIYELSMLPFTGPNSKAIVNNCLTGGKAVGPACWYRGNQNENCISVCNRVNTNVAPDPETINFAGSGGSEANCHEVGKAFGAGKGNQVNGTPVGCILSSNQAYWFSSPTTDYSTGMYERLCACK